VIIAYKDPVENQQLKKIIDKFVTEFFVVTLGILWHYSSKYQVKPNQYTILIYDVFGNQIKIDGIRTSFSTYRVTNSYISEYQNRFHIMIFQWQQKLNEKYCLELLKKFKDNEFSCEHSILPHTWLQIHNECMKTCHFEIQWHPLQ